MGEGTTATVGESVTRGPRAAGGRPGPRSWWKVAASVTTAFALCGRGQRPQGISDADLPHVFDRFYRAEESRSMPGSGLGLSIVRQVVERHSGSVTAGRCPSGGSRFTVQLPGALTPPDSSSDRAAALEQTTH